MGHPAPAAQAPGAPHHRPRSRALAATTGVAAPVPSGARHGWGLSGGGGGRHPAAGLRAPARATGEGSAQGVGQPPSRGAGKAAGRRQGAAVTQGPAGPGPGRPSTRSPPKPGDPGAPQRTLPPLPHTVQPQPPTSSDAGTRWCGLPRATPAPRQAQGHVVWGPTRGWLGAHKRDQREVRS